MICPYCKKNNIDILQTRYESLIYRSSFFKNNKLVKIQPLFCRDCCLGFNETNLNEAIKEELFKEFTSVEANAGIGSSNYTSFINFILKNTKQDFNIVDIGCYDGFVLENLYKNGYRDLSGYDPNINIKNKEIKAYKELFTKDTCLTKKVDAFLLGNILEVIPSIDDFMQVLHKNLNQNGKVLIEVPSISSINLVQAWRFSPIFFEKLALNNLFKIVDVDNAFCKDKFYNYRLALEKIESNVYYEEYFNKEEVDAIYQNTLLHINSEDFDVNFINTLITLIQSNNENKRDTIIWGGGIFTFRILEAIMHKDMSLLKDSNIVILDSDKSKDGAYFLAPHNVFLKTRYAYDFLKECHTIANIILGVSSDNFIKEIKASIKDLNNNFNVEVFEILTKYGVEEI